MFHEFFSYGREAFKPISAAAGFQVPSSVLDGMFDNEDDIQILDDAWGALIKDGFQEDEAAKEISAMIFKELNIEPDQLFEDEKESK